MRIIKTIAFVFFIWILIAWRVLAFTINTYSPVNIDNKSATTTWSITHNGSANISAGKLVLLIIGSDNLNGSSDGDNGDVQSISDGVGNTFLKIAEHTNLQSGAGTGATISVWYSILTTGVTVGSTSLSITFNGSVTAKALMEASFNITSGNTIAWEYTVFINSASYDNFALGPLSFSGLTSREYLWVRAWAGERVTGTVTGTSTYASFFSSSPPYETGTSGGGGASNMSVGGEYKISTNTGETSSPTTTSGDQSSVFIAIYEVAPAASKPRRLYRLK